MLQRALTAIESIERRADEDRRIFVASLGLALSFGLYVQQRLLMRRHERHAASHPVRLTRRRMAASGDVQSRHGPSLGTASAISRTDQT